MFGIVYLDTIDYGMYIFIRIYIYILVPLFTYKILHIYFTLQPNLPLTTNTPPGKKLAVVVLWEGNHLELETKAKQVWKMDGWQFGDLKQPFPMQVKVWDSHHPIYIRVSTQKYGKTPQIIHFNRVSIINHSFWGTPIFGKHP